MAGNYKNLQDFIEFLEQKNDLIRIKTKVSWNLEITEITQRVLQNGGPALLFEDVADSDFPVLINIFGTEQRMAWALGVENLNQIAEKIETLLGTVQGPPTGIVNKIKLLGDLINVARIGPKHHAKAPSQEIIHTGDAIDITKLPILKTWPLDGGRYITLPLVITKDPETNIHNIGMYRMQVFDKKTTGMHWQTQKVGRHHQTLEKKNGSSKMEVAVALGGDPALIWSGSAPVPPDINEYLLSGFIRNKGVSVTKGITVDLDIPSEAEFIIEGFVDPNESRKEGPFGDHTGYYSIEDEYPVFHVTAVTHRKNPIYPTIVVGRPPQEDYWLGKATERIFLPIMKLTIPEIIDVHMPAEGVFHNLILVSMNREYPGQAQKVAHGLWGLGLMSLTRAIVLLDSDVDLNNPSEVLWRITSNTDPRRDIFFSEGPLDDLDVSSPTGHVGSKIGIDATRKTNESEMGNRKWMPDITMDEDIIEQVTAKWKEYGI